MPKLTPDNILGFMSVNLVKTPSTSTVVIPYADQPKKLVWAHLEAVGGGNLTNKKADDAAVYSLEFLSPEDAAGNDDAFLIYWVEYKGDGPGTATWLGSDSPFMFTALMTGCSLGLGSKTSKGVMVAHVNSMSKSQSRGVPDEAQKQDQHEKLAKLGLTDKVVTIDDYLPGPFDVAMKTTPFGFRPPYALPQGKFLTKTPRFYGSDSTGDWKFYWLQFRQQGPNMTHMGVHKHAGGLF